MKVANVVIDTNDMSFRDVDNLIKQLRIVRERKGELRSRLNMFRSTITNMRKEEGMTLVSKTTGEVLNPDEWELYDEMAHSFYHEGEDN